MTPPVELRTLVLGGTRSGKSRHAEELLGDDAAVRYLATGRRIPGDTDWDARIAAHAARRPDHWTTEEVGGTELATALARPGPVLVDDLATWLTGVLDDAGAWDAPVVPATVDAAVDGLVAAVAAAPGPLVLVSAETGLGVVPDTRAGRLFRDRLGELNAAVARVCDDVVLVVAGRALTLPTPAVTEPGAGVAPTPGPAGGSATPERTGVPAAGAGGPVGTDVADPDGDVAGTPAGVPGAVLPATGAAAGAVAGAATPPASITESDVEIVPVTVGRPDSRSRRAAVALVEGLAMPTGGLGRLGELGVWLASCQGTCPPQAPVRARVVLLAADHGIAGNGVSAYPPQVSAVRATAAAAGRLPVTVAARAAGATVRVVDVGLVSGAEGAEPGWLVAHGTGRIDREDALDGERATAAWLTGRRLADAEIDAGADLLIPATLGVGVTTPAATLVAAVTGAEPVAVVGRASGIDDRAWMRKAVAIRDALRRARPHLRDPLALLRTVGGTDLIVLAGFLARAAERKVPAVLDGLAVGAAALLADELAPGAKDWWVAAQPSTEPAATLVLEHLSLVPLLDLAVRTEDGTAAVTALPLLVTAARLLAETGTAHDTGVVPGDVTAPAGLGR
ncbi:bifunctional adenosylcobinamide kinase/adenosylcobinamide-phosphate guanylyltransferase [Pseudonocardia alni]|uniref:Nicotinate-nucleotide--dimethylbenzimidazole phosphoribosyltransferase n=1 Tax=Pseudonocardia alni TaxID=33907 RepID=A0A852WGP6_PSEA5|nr:bifunctional adenosylcobinamide kinase/adenosylcobinamide-phosphate guanylyltransferase [Pseudonocardia antarctica]NYG04756.1 nicotinate-nucleotide--dimethylbenzimidazole phosphoribosyltransferase [Pseudonocardia antarctica]